MGGAKNGVENPFSRKLNQPQSARRRGSLLLSAGVVIALPLLAIASVFGCRVWRVASARQSLDSLHAEYAWQHETFDLSHHERPCRWLGRLANWVGDSTVSEVSMVEVDAPTVDDDQLGFLDRLLQVRSLELNCPLATDRTLQVIHRLPNLRYLTLVDGKFSILGLLQLRQLPHLKSLNLDCRQYSDVELAVLKIELAGVEICDVARNAPEGYAVESGIQRPAA